MTGDPEQVTNRLRQTETVIAVEREHSDTNHWKTLRLAPPSSDLPENGHSLSTARRRLPVGVLTPTDDTAVCPKGTGMHFATVD